MTPSGLSRIIYIVTTKRVGSHEVLFMPFPYFCLPIQFLSRPVFWEIVALSSLRGPPCWNQQQASKNTRFLCSLRVCASTVSPSSRASASKIPDPAVAFVNDRFVSDHLGN